MCYVIEKIIKVILQKLCNKCRMINADDVYAKEPDFICANYV